jgi:hypothetical protein
MAATKIATCCYCGSRSALELRGKTQHELACGNCGAPLHNLKMLLKAQVAAVEPQHRGLVKPSRITQKTSRSDKGFKWEKPKKVSKKSKKKKGLGRWLLEEAWDAIEDIID